ncbi:TetR/AcrR family transcriptional regulator [Actinoplanes auranticolor]|uniref:TetR family transcriptional regulator n=1 Tax=Actinoplanes auranticolor TaxID=47988 RepID=A0A919SYX3_9ACTN|nr:TetR/AcrR family transcriptional regulator [Actinoplanes auranticolor]GIM79956.1 TetR family transcriptional regulator [Actinoplanes auranticolor]
MTAPGPADPAGRRRRADATRSIERLTATAREIFAERGHDVALDEIARRAGVGNATLYRHFPTRSDLIVAVYSREVADLARRGAELLTAPDTAESLLTWLDHFVAHVATKRSLALAAASTDRGVLFARWHDSMISTADALLRRAQGDARIGPDIAVTDLLALANGAALGGTDLTQARRLLRLAWHGLEEKT